ncbi:MAG: calcium-binding protein [Limnobacter sp.]|uniref:calcium-binding protein n=1 Tax=Limnobacter sp. TaxID=2003368 RepID=UPI00391D5117
MKAFTQLGSPSNHVRVMDHFVGNSNTASSLDKIIFADGATWNIATINAATAMLPTNPDYS